MKKNKKYVIDCGKNQAVIYDGEIVRSISHEDILALPDELQRGDTVIGEYSHFGCPRRIASKAQPFEEKVLLGWYERFREAGITLKFFPQKSTPRASVLVHGYKTDKDGKNHIEKSDEADTIAIFNFLFKEPQGKRASLMKPPTSFEEDLLREEGNEWKKVNDTLLNYARSTNYKDPDDKNAEWLGDNAEIIRSRLSPEAQDIFGYNTLYKSSSKHGTKGEVNKNAINMVQVYSVLAALRLPDGNWRQRSMTNTFPGWKFIRGYVFCMTPFHLKGGVARSNFYHHGLRGYATRMAKANEGFAFTKKTNSYRNMGTFSNEEREAFLKYRKQYCAAIKELFMLFKDMLQEKE